jgi:hypothetical protein
MRVGAVFDISNSRKNPAGRQSSCCRVAEGRKGKTPGRESEDRMPGMRVILKIGQKTKMRCTGCMANLYLLRLHLLSPPFMKEKTIAILALVLLRSFAATAQYDDLLSDRAVGWVAEYTADFSLNPVTYTFRFFEESDYEPDNELNVISLSALPNASGLYSHQDLEQYFSQKIFQAARNGVFPLFKDEALEEPLDTAAFARLLVRIDTVYAHVPESFDQPEFTIVRSDINYDQIVSFKVRQVFFFNKTERKFGSRLLALAPMIDKKDVDGNYIETVPLVWIKLENTPKGREKGLPEGALYIFETKMQGNAPGYKSFVTKKGRMDFLSLIVDEVARPSHPVFNHKFESIQPASLQGMVQTIDTVTTRDPETWEERTEIIQRNAIKDVERISFVQQWFYDDRKKMFFNRVTAMAPVVVVKDPEGNPQFKKPLFYWMNE